MDTLALLLSRHGPQRASFVGDQLQAEFGLSPEAARKRLSRSRQPVRSFPFSLLPKREAFLYLEDDRGSERFWKNFLTALRETESVYGAAIDALIARGGVVARDEFAVISGAPLKQKRHVSSSLVLERLCEAGFLEQMNHVDIGEAVALRPLELGFPDFSGFRSRRIVEGVILDGIREWARKLGFASYNQIAIRGDDHPRRIGPYQWDLTGPSYLLPLRNEASPGFLAADVFASDHITAHQIRYMVRKATGLRATTNVGRVLPLLVCSGFDGEAATAAHRAGIVLSTPSLLFGNHVGRALLDLLATLNKAAEIVSGNPDRIAGLIENLSEIAGAAGNLQGVLFELMAAFVVRHEGSSIDMGRLAFDPTTGKRADIDILLVRGKSHCTVIECKGKGPGNNVTLDEVEEWLQKLPVFHHHIRSQENLREAELRYELWTSGGFEEDALQKLQLEKQRRTNSPIEWLNGKAFRERCKALKESRIKRAFDEFFFKNPLSQ